jgi:hypothetical protein
MSKTTFGMQLHNLLGAEHRDFLLPVGEIPVYMSKSSSKAIGSAVMDPGRVTCVLNISVPADIQRFWHTYKKTYDSTIMESDKSSNYLRKRLDNVILHKTE